ncbi:MAG: hypothetical protein A3C47_03710 [Omnitrophica bacterium RIFCSPHIGHO2_02_FULL_51_18]|nr:MAG: hypothetical protein A3C47_03710 [Omnitrophica bacterium RIFCSPHIGHO2_02_FULL_51_18]
MKYCFKNLSIVSLCYNKNSFMKISFLLYPTHNVKVNEDSSFWMMLELQKRGHEVSYFESKDLFWADAAPRAYAASARLNAQKGYLPSPLSKHPVNLAGVDCIFIRKEPPFDADYLYALQLLENIRDTVFVLNDPAGIAVCNEKLFSLRFKKYAPESFVTENPERARAFIASLKAKVIVKPLNEKGGVGIVATSCGDRNLASLLHSATHSGREKVIIQRFVSADRYGDKRIIILNGEPLGAFLRRPPRHDFRANLSTGGSMHKAPLTAWDKKLVCEMAPLLLKHGLYFVGIDVIGRYLTEVNVTSPAGIPELHSLNKLRLEKKVADFIERRLGL